MSTDFLTGSLNEPVADGECADKSSLQHLLPTEAMDQMSSTLLEYRRYCKDHQLKFLSYLVEMAVMEAIEVRIAMDKDEAKSTVSSIPATHMELQDESDDHNHDPR